VTPPLPTLRATARKKYVVDGASAATGTSTHASFGDAASCTTLDVADSAFGSVPYSNQAVPAEPAAFANAPSVADRAATSKASYVETTGPAARVAKVWSAP
jgi:hypothetical protein